MELVEALKNDLQEREDLRQMCVAAPKFGNDGDYVDLLAGDVSLRTIQVLQSVKNNFSGFFMEDGNEGASYFTYSGLTGATPDGRKDMDLFNDGTIPPAINTDKKGPTAVLKSVSKINHTMTFIHLFNQKFLPPMSQGDSKAKFISSMRTFVSSGIHHIQFNVINKETLIDAQENPSKHRDLVIREAKPAAYFVDLEKTIQDQIIDRPDQNLYS